MAGLGDTREMTARPAIRAEGCGGICVVPFSGGVKFCQDGHAAYPPESFPESEKPCWISILLTINIETSNPGKVNTSQNMSMAQITEISVAATPDSRLEHKRPVRHFPPRGCGFFRDRSSKSRPRQ
jgi:hypothetical protein